MIKLTALEAIDDQDGKFAKGEQFWVNQERASVLMRTEKAEVSADQSVETEETTRRGRRTASDAATSASS